MQAGATEPIASEAFGKPKSGTDYIICIDQRLEVLEAERRGSHRSHLMVYGFMWVIVVLLDLFSTFSGFYWYFNTTQGNVISVAATIVGIVLNTFASMYIYRKAKEYGTKSGLHEKIVVLLEKYRRFYAAIREPITPVMQDMCNQEARKLEAVYEILVSDNYNGKIIDPRNTL